MLKPNAILYPLPLQYSLVTVSCTVSTFEVVVCYSLSYSVLLTMANNIFFPISLYLWAKLGLRAGPPFYRDAENAWVSRGRIPLLLLQVVPSLPLAEISIPGPYYHQTSTF